MAQILASLGKIVTVLAMEKKLERLYAISASKEGEAALKLLGFGLLKVSADRKDGHNLYLALYSDTIARVSERLRKLSLRST